jgi:hypothetical protein
VASDINYEDFNQWVVTLEVSDNFNGGANFHTVVSTVTINVVNINEAPYRKDTEVQPVISVQENTNVTTPLMQSFKSIFYDPDYTGISDTTPSMDLRGPLVYRVVSGLPTAAFTLSTLDMDGIFSIGQALNFEDMALLPAGVSGNSYELTIEASDSGWCSVLANGTEQCLGNLTVSAPVIVIITNQNEQCVVADQNRKIPEHTPASQLRFGADPDPSTVGAPIVATDVDQLKDSSATLYFEITSGNTYTSGGVTIAKVFRFRGADEAASIQDESGQIVVENPGIACCSGSSCEGKLCDDDIGETNNPALVYSSSGSTDKPNQYTLGITVTDNDGMSCQADVVVDVTDVNEKPVFLEEEGGNACANSSCFQAYLDENNRGPSETSPWSYTVFARDAEVVPANSNSQRLHFNLTSNSHEDVEFRITTEGTHGTQGRIELVNSANPSLNHETVTQIRLGITVIDDHDTRQASTAYLTIHVNDVNEPPVLQPDTPKPLTVNENDAVGFALPPIFLDVSSEASDAMDKLTMDQDEPFGNGTVTYSWTSSTAGAAAPQFLLNTTTCIVTVAGALNFEVTNQYQFILSAADAGTPSLDSVNQRTIIVNVIDINEPPYINSITPFSVREDAPASFCVATVSADDPDTNQNPPTVLTYTLGNRQPLNPSNSSTDVESKFNIDPSTGNVTLRAENSLDYEETTAYTINVTVTDNGENGVPRLQAHASQTIHVIDVNDVHIAKVQRTAERDPMNFDTRGGDTVVITGENFGPKPPEATYVGETYHNLSGPAPVIVVTYGGDDGKLYTAESCVVSTQNTKITCQTTAGVGLKLRFVVNVDGSESPLTLRDQDPLQTMTYKRPEVHTIDIPSPGTFPTRGGTTFIVNGDYFGPAVDSCPLSNIYSCPEVWYNATYNYPTYPTLRPDLQATGTDASDSYRVSYTAVGCQVISQTQLSCQTVEGSGHSLEWSMRIGEQESGYLPPTGNFTRPTITRARFHAYERACVSDAYNLGNATEGRGLSWCEETCEASSACKAVEWSGVAVDAAGGAVGPCQMKTTSVLCETCAPEQADETSRLCSGQTVYSPTISTEGTTWVRLLGANLGPNPQGYSAVETEADLVGIAEVSASYGPSPRGEEPYASFKACRVVTPHAEIECPTVPGVGKDHKWQVRVGGQLSSWDAALNEVEVITSYAVPVLRSVAGAGSKEADTHGDEEIVLTGANFGPVQSETTRMYIRYRGDTRGTSYSLSARYGPPAACATWPVARVMWWGVAATQPRRKSPTRRRRCRRPRRGPSAW